MVDYKANVVTRCRGFLLDSSGEEMAGCVDGAGIRVADADVGSVEGRWRK